MPTPQRPQPTAVIDRLLAQPHDFGFFQAVRLLERWFVRSGAQSSDQVLTTRLAFRNNLSLAFPASEIAQLSVRRVVGDAAAAAAPTDARAVAQVEITPAFIGLLGASGTLPVHYTELFARREGFQRDRAGRAFLDIFLHRSTVLFYQAWRKHRLGVQFEADRRQRYLPLMLSLAGLGHPGLHRRLRGAEGGVADDALAFYAGALQQRPTSAAVLRRVLEHYFKVPVKLDQFVGRWFDLAAEHQSHLGRARVKLGADALIGERVWQRDLRLRITLGPLDRERFTRFLPGGAGALALRELLALLAGPTFEFELKLSLQASEVKGVRLSPASPPRLGWDSFLITRASPVDRADAGYELLAA
jgi:type VI secretion system protein ImpH